jgi:hypothetical protein
LLVGIEINDGGRDLGSGGGSGKVDCKCGFPGSAFLVRDSNGFAHGSSCVDASKCLHLYEWNIKGIGVI